MLVERLAASFWRLRRAYRFEVEAITHANLPNPLADALDELSHLQPVPRGECILPPPDSLDCLIRYETMIDRELLRTMRQLDLRQRLRKIEQAPIPMGSTTDKSRRAGMPMPPERAKAPAPNEPTAMPSAGSATRCERRSSLAGAAPRTSMLHGGFPTLAAQDWGTHTVRPAHPAVLMCCPHRRQAASLRP
ncbi:MAG: hypothetical protein IH895_06265 [Planctomycetes bacterium]|nr:hypothetical protein [Planctomycetota bacterium]